MDHQRKERMVDDVLNRALGPQLVEPREGLEGRILANLATVPPRRPWWRWMWVPVLAAAAVLAIAIGLRMMQHETPKPIEANKTVEAPKQEVATAKENPAVKTSADNRALFDLIHHAHVVSNLKTPPDPIEPRLDSFPSRGTLTPEEKLLVAFVRQQPGHARSVALEQQAHADEVQKYWDKGELPVSQASGITTK